MTVEKVLLIVSLSFISYLVGVVAGLSFDVVKIEEKKCVEYWGEVMRRVPIRCLKGDPRLERTMNEVY